MRDRRLTAVIATGLVFSPIIGDELLIPFLGANTMDDTQVQNRNGNARLGIAQDQSVANAIIVINVLAIATIILIAGIGFRGYIGN